MLDVISLQAAMRLAETELCVRPLGTRRLPLDLAAGRVLAEDIVSAENVPAFDRSTMDGYAVRAADTFGAGPAIPAMLRLTGEVLMGEETDLTLAPGSCAAIPTGGMLPQGADAVVPVEYTELTGDLCLCYAAVSPLQNVTRAGDDVAFGRTVLPKGTPLSPAAVGVLAAMGKGEVAVYNKPRVGILSTGDELVEVTKTPRPGEVRDVNAHLLAALAAGWGCEPHCCGIIKDNEDLLTSAVMKAAAENDILLLSGGSSAGKADRTAALVEKLGTLFCHGIAVKPGKPTVLGTVGGTAVFGLPGHPAACYFTAMLLVKRHVDALFGLKREAPAITAKLTEHVSSNHGREELLCVRLAGGKASPVYGKSGVISQLCLSDGFIVIPRESEGLAKGAEILVYPF